MRACPASALPRRGTTMRLAFEGLTATVEVPDCPEFASALRASAVDWPFRRVEADAEPAARITRSGQSLLIHYPDEEPLPVTPVAAACSLMVSLAEALVAENPDRLCFHGGAALFGGRLVIFPGRSHAGKSTMIARLAAGGHTVFGDDILPLDPSEDGLALGVAPRLRLPLPPCASAAFRGFVADHAGAADGRYHYLALPEGRLARHGATAPLGAIVLLDRRPAGPATLHEAPERLALKLLARQSVLGADDTRPLLARMRAIVRRLPCLVLSYADLEEAVVLLEATFARWPMRVAPAPLPDEAALTRRLLERDEAGDDEPESPSGYRPGMRLVRHPDVALHAVDGEAFLAGTGGTAAIHHLNPVGAGIWNLLAHPTDEDEAASVIAVAFPDVDPRIVARDVAVLFADLHASGFAVEAAEPR